MDWEKLLQVNLLKFKHTSTSPKLLLDKDLFKASKN